MFSKYRYLLVLLFCPILLVGQDFVYMDIGVGTQGNKDIPLADFDLGLGFIIVKNLNCFGGFKLSKHFLHSEILEADNNITNSILSLNLYIGVSNYFEIIKFEENSLFESFGIFPEFRLFLNPWLPQEITYEQDGEIITSRGNYNIQASYGYGGGLFLKTKSGLIAFKCELNTNDPFKVLRSINYGEKKMPFSKGKQLLFSLRFSGF